MDFKIGTPVFTEDGEKAGSVDRIVIEPETSEVTHLVVHKGFLFTEDKVIPMSMVGPSTEEKVKLRISSNALDQLADFIETEYISASRAPISGTMPSIAEKERIQALYMYPRVGTLGPSTSYPIPYYVRKTENIPDGTVALEEGAKVMTIDREHVGNVERILTDSQQNRATHILISEGVFLKEKKLVPTGWIKTVLPNEIDLAVDSEFIEHLPEYQPQE